MGEGSPGSHTFAILCLFACLLVCLSVVSAFYAIFDHDPLLSSISFSQLFVLRNGRYFLVSILYGLMNGEWDLRVLLVCAGQRLVCDLYPYVCVCARPCVSECVCACACVSVLMDMNQPLSAPLHLAVLFFMCPLGFASVYPVLVMSLY